LHERTAKGEFVDGEPWPTLPASAPLRRLGDGDAAGYTRCAGDLLLAVGSIVVVPAWRLLASGRRGRIHVKQRLAKNGPRSFFFTIYECPIAARR